MGDIHINGKLLSRSWADQHPIKWQFELQKAYMDSGKLEIRNGTVFTQSEHYRDYDGVVIPQLRYDQEISLRNGCGAS